MPFYSKIETKLFCKLIDTYNNRPKLKENYQNEQKAYSKYNRNYITFI